MGLQKVNPKFKCIETGVFTGDYTYGMWQMLQHDSPDDWVLATGQSYTVEKFAETAFSEVGLGQGEVCCNLRKVHETK